MAADDTRAAILEAAETLFSARGYGAVGLREIARQAEVHPSSINYHFGGKLGCLEALYERYTAPINARRRELIGEASRIAGRRERMGAILRGYLLPAFVALDDRSGGARFTRLRAVLSAEGDGEARAIIARSFDDMSTLLIDKLAECLPAARREDIVWQCHFLLGALYYTLINPERIERLSGGTALAGDHERAIAMLVRSTTAGLEAFSRLDGLQTEEFSQGG